MDLTCNEEMLPAGLTPVFRGAGRTEQTQVDEINEIPTSVPHQEYSYPDDILLYLLKGDGHNRPNPDYFLLIQQDIRKDMRTIVCTWMRDVCVEEKVMTSVFPLATIIMDRFLSVYNIEREQFQLIGATCLYLSSKWAGAGSLIRANSLVYYAAHSITRKMLLAWEEIVMKELMYDVFSNTATEFIDPILERLPHNHWDPETLKKAFFNYSAYCYIDFDYSNFAPSILAAASMGAAIIETCSLSQDTMEDILSQLVTITGVERNLITTMSQEIRTKAKLLENLSDPGTPPIPGGISGIKPLDIIPEEAPTFMEYEELEPVDTPTDVHDIQF